MLCATLCEALAVKFKANYLVLFMEDDSINSGALMLRERGATLQAALPAGLALPVQSSLLTLPSRCTALHAEGSRGEGKKEEGWRRR